MAGSAIIGLGVGVVILLVVWTLVLIAWVQLPPQQASLRTLVTLGSILITFILLIIPTEKGDKGVEDEDLLDPDLLSMEDAFVVYDYMFIWKAVLMGLMFLALVASLITYVKEFWTVKVHGGPSVPTEKSFSDFQ